MPTVETALALISELDLSRVIQVVDQTTYFTNFDYDVLLTNPHIEPLTLSVSVTPFYYNAGLISNINSGIPSLTDLLTGATTIDSMYFGLMYDSRYDAATETWDQVILQPGETLVLTDKFYYGGSSNTSWLAPFNDYGFAVTLTDSATGTTYVDPLAGWFQG